MQPDLNLSRVKSTFINDYLFFIFPKKEVWQK
jgi:hypothetical protein